MQTTWTGLKIEEKGKMEQNYVNVCEVGYCSIIDCIQYFRNHIQFLNIRKKIVPNNKGNTMYDYSFILHRVSVIFESLLMLQFHPNYKPSVLTAH